MIDFADNDQQARIGRLRLSAGFRSRSGGGASFKSNPHSVVMKGSYRFHKGGKAKSNPTARQEASLKYLAGERRDQIEKGTSEQRTLFTDKGQETTAGEAFSRHQEAGVFIEHRIILSPAGEAKDNELHLLAQSTISEIRSRNPRAEIEASYAIHRDTDNPHAHLHITSLNKLELRKEGYQHLRQHAAELREELHHERQLGREHSHTIDQAMGRDQQPDEQGIER